MILEEILSLEYVKNNRRDKIRRELKDLEKSLQKPTVDDKIDRIIANINKRDI
jgi:hypothetical protein